MASTMSRAGFASFLASTMSRNGRNGWVVELEMEKLESRRGFAVYRIYTCHRLVTSLTEYKTQSRRTIRVRL